MLAGDRIEVLDVERPEAGVDVARMVQHNDPLARRERIERSKSGQAVSFGSGGVAPAGNGKALKCPTFVVTSSPTTGVKKVRTPMRTAAAVRSLVKWSWWQR